MYVHAQSCPALCYALDYSSPGSFVHSIFQEYWSGLPFPSPGGLWNTGIKPGSPALQAVYLPLCFLGGCGANKKPPTKDTFELTGNILSTSRSSLGGLGLISAFAQDIMVFVIVMKKILCPNNDTMLSEKEMSYLKQD